MTWNSASLKGMVILQDCCFCPMILYERSHVKASLYKNSFAKYISKENMAFYIKQTQQRVVIEV